MSDKSETGDSITEAFSDTLVNELRSPIQEHHIDFLLEEEFLCDPQFLSLFLDAAKLHLRSYTDDVAINNILSASDSWKCSAVRSATTSEGETDVLVVYESASSTHPRVAIMIENKIRAIFQYRQSERYRIRGENGVGKRWDFYWTCLVCPEKYASDNKGFDSRISLEKIRSFFSQADRRGRFKATIIDQAVKHYSATGIQSIDPAVTSFRRFYAEEAERFFQGSEVTWEEARDAWRDDTWIHFHVAGQPKGSQVTYKPKKGSVELVLPGVSLQSLETILDGSINKHQITVRPVGQNAGFCVSLDRIPSFEFADATKVKPIVLDSLKCVEKLSSFCKANASLLTPIRSNG